LLVSRRNSVIPTAEPPSHTPYSNQAKTEWNKHELQNGTIAQKNKVIWVTNTHSVQLRVDELMSRESGEKHSARMHPFLQSLWFQLQRLHSSWKAFSKDAPLTALFSNTYFAKCGNFQDFITVPNVQHIWGFPGCKTASMYKSTTMF
jgi:hypothetical protein